eukprot:scaffold310715_cov32-Tisochrysis_lutea.AAC.4
MSERREKREKGIRPSSRGYPSSTLRRRPKVGARPAIIEKKTEGGSDVRCVRYVGAQWTVAR